MRIIPVLLLLSLPGVASAQIAPPGRDASSPPTPVTIKPGPGGSYDRQVARDEIKDGRRSGTLTKSQARQLRREADRGDALASRYGRDGLSDSERRDLDMQGQALRSIIQGERSRPPAGTRP